jgi:hypothetical protein
MKGTLIIVAFIICSFTSFAQYAEEKGFKKENLYIGAGINVNFFQGWILGVNPEVGYSLTNFLDAGIATNVNYITQNAGNGVSARFFSYGGGPYLRGWILDRFFLTGQYEYNRISQSFNNGSQIIKSKYSSPSILVGGGWGTRIKGQSQFFTSIMVDVLRNRNSPYLDNTTNTLLPVFRTGFMFYLRPKSQKS